MFDKPTICPDEDKKLLPFTAPGSQSAALALPRPALTGPAVLLSALIRSGQRGSLQGNDVSRFCLSLRANIAPYRNPCKPARLQER